LVYFGYRKKEECAMKAYKYGILAVCLLFMCLSVLTFADEASPGKPDAAAEALKSELQLKNKEIAELQEKIKSLENEIKSIKKLNIEELQEYINTELGEYEGVIYRAALSGNKDEIRVKVEVDLSLCRTDWYKLTNNKKKQMLTEICGAIQGEYPDVKIKGYVKDISGSKKLLTFYNKYNGNVEIGSYKNYSTISSLEDRFNNDYSSYLNKMHFTYRLNGNENRIEYFADIQLGKFGEQWNKVSEYAVKNFMKKLNSEIRKEFGNGCAVIGHIYDTDGKVELAYCSLSPDSDFEFTLGSD